MIGETISHYKILEKLGEGGMGVVYKAQDTKLNRTVALKFLPEHISASEKDAARFMQEAQAAASLNHPNICTIYGIEESDGRHFIVMEFVDGQMLQEKKSSLSHKQAVEVGIQIAEGLAAAHEKGIVHRDIKPENIMIRKDGIVQIMDFGLAKLRGASRLTKEGSTVGTAGYMSPEQVQGQDTDHRSDIFSLGVLLYEMLSGQFPFKGVHETAIAYEIVNVDSPPMSSIKPEISPELDSIVLECLEKDPNERAQSAKQIAIDLKRHKRESSKSRFSRTMPVQQFERGTSEQVVKQKSALQSYGKFVWPLITSALVVAVALLLWSPWQTQELQRPVMRFSVELSEDALLTFNLSSLDFSPDGKFIVYTGNPMGNSQLFLRPTDDLAVRPLSGTAGGLYPSFSPDGQWIAYEVNGILMKVSVSGGATQRLCNLQGQSRGLTWVNDREIMFGHVNRGILRVSADGGEPVAVTAMDSVSGEISHRFPQVLPDGNTVLFTVKQSTISTFDDAIIVAERLDTKERKVVVRGGSFGRYVPSGHLIFVRGGAIYHLLRKTMTRFTFGGGNSASPIWSPDGKYVAYASERGTSVDIFRKPWDGSGAEERLTTGLALSEMTSYSPDGKAIAFVQNGDIWILPLDGDRTPTPFVHTPASEATPRFSPDGRWLAYSSNESGRDEVYVVPYPRSPGKYQISSGGGVFPLWTRDGKELCFVSSSSTARRGGAGLAIMSVQITGTAPFDYSAQRRLVTLPPSGAVTDIAADGQRFLLATFRSQAVAQSTLTVVLEWFEDLKARTSGTNTGK